MAIRSLTQLKAWFQKGKYPTAAQFGDWMDSFFHKEEDRIPIASVDELSERLNGKYNQADGEALEKRTQKVIEDLDTHKKAYAEEVETIHTNLEELEAEDERLDGRITTETNRATGEEAAIRRELTEGDAATLSAGKAFTTEREGVLRSEMQEGDAATLTLANEHTNTREATIREDMTAGDAATLQSAKSYTETRETAVRGDMTSGDAAMLASAKKYADDKIADVIGGSPEALDTLKELSAALGDDPNFAATVAGQIGGKVDKVAGKGLSTEDFTTTEKQKLAGVASGANNYTHPTSHPAAMIAEDTTHRFITDAEREAWNSKPGSGMATGSSAGLMSPADKSKLDGIAVGANDYQHPASHPATMIATDDTHQFVTAAEKSAWNAKAAATAATQSAMGLMSAADKKKLDGIAAGANAYTHPASHPATMIAQDTTHRFVTDTEKAAWNSKTEALHSVTYAELVTLRNGKKLVPGHYYRITNFVTTVANDPEARSAGHPFDIIVLATAADTLSEEARAIVNERNAAYFATANLDAWKVCYCLDNDTTRFQWADEANGRGVIYRLIDEWQNNCPYDFKNIQFKRYRASATGALTDAINGRYYAFRSGMMGVEIEDVDDFMWAYTFTLIDDSGQWRDYSVMKDALNAATDWGYFKQFGIGRCEYNLIRNSYAAVTVDEKCHRALMLNNIVLLAEFDGSGLPSEMQLNIFGDGNYNMTLKDAPEQNHFGNKCYGNIVGAYGNTFGNGCSSITFGNGCSSNTFGNDCWGNTFGNYCGSNSFGNYCGSNSFGNNVRYNALGACLYCLTVYDGVEYVSVVGGTSNRSYVQYAQILNGTCGQNGSNRLQISFKANVKYCQFAGLNSSGILKIWTPTDLV